MKLEQKQWTPKNGWNTQGTKLGAKAGLVMVFGENSLLADGKHLAHLREMYPQAHVFGCSTAGEIHGDGVYDDTLSVTAIQFEKTEVQAASMPVSPAGSSRDAGRKLARALPHTNLRHVLVLSIGININGSELVKGLTEALPPEVTVTGGLAGDQGRFQETLVVSDAGVSNETLAVIGLYGSHIHIGSASLGGWDPFGPDRLVTKSVDNVLYELDGQSALELYKTYLGDHAKDLPGSALLFPLSFRSNETETALVRTILAVDEKEQSLTFAGDIPQGVVARFMKANFDRVIEGAVVAAQNSMGGKTLRSRKPPELALLISCVGRKLVLKQRVEEEVEGVRDIFGPSTLFTGFYSYGEISPFTPNAKCELHNQTMTITTFSEEDETAA